MYPIDERDIVLEVDDVPKPRGGAPMPLVLADDNLLVLSYFVADRSPDADDSVRAAIVQFNLPLIHLFGPPNDEAIKGHPLWRRGLNSYAAYRVEESSLLRRLAAMNSVHPRNDASAFGRFHHYIVTFEDSTFECIAQSYTSAIEQFVSDDERYSRVLGTLRTRDDALRSEAKAQSGKPTAPGHVTRLLRALKPWSQ